MTSLLDYFNYFNWLHRASHYASTLRAHFLDLSSLLPNQLRASYDYKKLLKIKYPLRTMKIEGTILEHEQLYSTMQYTLYIDSSYRLISNSSSGNWEKVENFLGLFHLWFKFPDLIDKLGLIHLYHLLASVGGK